MGKYTVLHLFDFPPCVDWRTSKYLPQDFNATEKGFSRWLKQGFEIFYVNIYVTGNIFNIHIMHSFNGIIGKVCFANKPCKCWQYLSEIVFNLTYPNLTFY